jgi:DNA-binding MarR family transcriptional regulator
MKEAEFCWRRHLPDPNDYHLDAQVGFLLRRANQRHLSIFAKAVSDLTPTQFAALAKLLEHGAMSQNDLGRRTAMDAATMKGVVDRLARKGLVETRSDATDLRRVIAALTPAGTDLIAATIPTAREVTEATLAPLEQDERDTLLALLAKMAEPAKRK